MKVGDQCIDHTKRESRRDEDVRLAAVGSQFARRFRGKSRSLQRTDHRGAHCNDPAAALAAALNGRSGFLRYRIALAVHAVLRDVVDTNRLERSSAHVQRDFGHLDACVGQFGQQRLGEMQACSRRRDRAGNIGVDRLVARDIRCIRRPFDVGRQRHFADRGQHVMYRTGKAQVVELFLAPDHFEHNITGAQASPRLQRLADPHLTSGNGFRKHAFEQNFSASARILFGEHPRWDHSSIVEHQQIARSQLRADLAEPAVGQIFSTHNQQTGRIPLGRWCLRDAIRRQFKVEISKLHWRYRPMGVDIIRAPHANGTLRLFLRCGPIH